MKIEVIIFFHEIVCSVPVVVSILEEISGAQFPQL